MNSKLNYEYGLAAGVVVVMAVLLGLIVERAGAETLHCHFPDENHPVNYYGPQLGDLDCPVYVPPAPPETAPEPTVDLPPPPVPPAPEPRSERRYEGCEEITIDLATGEEVLRQWNQGLPGCSLNEEPEPEPVRQAQWFTAPWGQTYWAEPADWGGWVLFTEPDGIPVGTWTGQIGAI